MDEFRLAVEKLAASGKTLATAESCTGGLLGKLVTDVPGASRVYLGGVISYAYEVKEKLLNVRPEILREQGAVCEEVALQMAEGARLRLGADLALSTTGNAGPSADPLNPNVGEIFVALSSAAGTVCRRLLLQGGREENRFAACSAAVELLLENEMK